MTDQVLRGGIEVYGDVSQFEAAMAKAEQVAGRFEKSAVDAAGKGSAALANTGKGATEAAGEIDRATQRTVASLQRQIAQIELSKAGYQSFLAQARGADEATYGPLIARLSAAEKAMASMTTKTAPAAAGLNLVGISAGQASNALRQLPAQFTDIFTSLAAGQPALTVFLQQGGQIRDTFGGFGNAFKAITSLITPAVVLLGSAAAAVAALASAYKQGSAERDAFVRGLTLTGNAAGTTAGQLNEMAKAIDGIAGTQGNAAAVIAQIAESSKVGASNIEALAAAAIQLERAGGPAAQKTAEQFAALAKDPAAAVRKLNEETNFLTIEVYRQVKALQEQGKEAEAAALAQSKYADAVSSRAKDLENNLGSLERGWRAVKDIAKEAWDAMLNIGRQETAEDRIKEVQQQLSTFKPGDTRPLIVAARQRLENDLAQLTQQVYAEREAATAAALRADSTKKTIAADDEASKAAKKHADALERLRKAGEDLLADAAGRVQQLRQEADQQGKLTEAQKFAFKAMEELRDGKVALSDAAKRSLVAYLEEAIALEKAAGAAEKMRDALQGLRDDQAAIDALNVQFARSYSAAVDQANRYAESLEDAGELLKLEAQLIGASDAARTRALATKQADLALTRQLQEVARRDGLGDAERKAIGEKYRAGRDMALGNIDLSSQNAALKQVDEFLDPSKAETFGEALSKAFAGANNSLVGLVNTLDRYGQSQAKLGKVRDALESISDPVLKNLELQRLSTAEQEAQLRLYGDLAGTAKGFFKEGSDGYRTLSALEAAFTIAQIASSFARSSAAATEAVLNQGKGDPYTAFARMAAMAAAVAQLGFATGFLGSGGSSETATAAQRQGGSATGRVITADQLDRNSSTFVRGTVFGDDEARSESVRKSLELLKDTADLTLPLTRQMASSLQNIEASMAGLASVIVRSVGGGLTSGKNLGIFEGTLSVNRGDPILNALGVGDSSLIGALADSGSIIGKIGEFANSLWGKTKQNIVDSGLSIMGQVSALIEGIGVQQFADVQTTTSSFFGLRKKTSTDTVFGPVEDAIATQFGLIFANIGKTLQTAGGALGADQQAIADQVGSFYVDIARLSLKDLKGEELQDAIAAAIGAQADLLAQQVLPGLDAFQQVGEGYFETLTRVASGIEVAEQALLKFGITAIDFTDIANKQGDVTAEIVRQSIAAFESADGSLSSVGEIINTLTGTGQDIAGVYANLVDLRQAMIAVGLSGDTLTTALVQGAGSLDDLASSVDTYFSEFFTPAEQLASKTAELESEFSRLGLAFPTTREAFKALVMQLEAAGPAAQKLLGAVLGFVDEADTVYDSSDEKLQRRFELENDLLRAQGREWEVVIRLRQKELEAMRALDPALATMLESLYAIEDAAAIADSLARFPGGAATSIGALNSGRGAIAESNQMQQLRDAFEQQLVTAGSAWKGYVDDWWKGAIPAVTRGALFNNFAMAELGKEITRLAVDPAAVAGQQRLQNGSAERAVIDQVAKDQLDATKQLIESLDRLESELSDYIDSLLTGNLSALSPEERFAEAQRQFQTTLSAARAGDMASRESVDDVAGTFLSIAQEFFGAASYNAVFNDVVKELQTLRAEMRATSAESSKLVAGTVAAAGSVTAGLMREGNANSERLASTAQLEKAANVG